MIELDWPLSWKSSVVEKRSFDNRSVDWYLVVTHSTIKCHVVPQFKMAALLFWRLTHQVARLALLFTPSSSRLRESWLAELHTDKCHFLPPALARHHVTARLTPACMQLAGVRSMLCCTTGRTKKHQACNWMTIQGHSDRHLAGYTTNRTITTLVRWTCWWAAVKNSVQ